MGLSNKTLQVKEDLILEVSAMRDQSLKELLKDMRQNLLYKNKVDKATVVNRLIEKYGVSKRYITMSLSGDRQSETSEAISKDYKAMLKWRI